MSRYFGVSQNSLHEAAASGYELAVILKQWYCGEKSGSQALADTVKIATENIARRLHIAGGTVGGWAGESIGTAYLGPIGGFVGVVVGAFGGSHVARTIVEKIYDMLMKYFFNSSQEKALENAYIFLEVTPDVSDGTIDQQFRRLSRKHHPDKGGNENDFLRLKMSQDLIREFRKGL